MSILKGMVFVCFIAIIILIVLTQIQLPALEKEYELEMGEISLPYTGWTPLDVIASSFCYMLKSPTMTSALLIFMYYVGVSIVSYLGSILGLFVVIIEKGKETDFVFALSFIGCVFFAIFTTVIATLL